MAESEESASADSWTPVKPSSIKKREPLVFNLAVPENFLSLRLADQVHEMEQAIRIANAPIALWREIGEVAIQKGLLIDYIDYLEEFLNSDDPDRARILSRKTRALESRLFEAVCESLGDDKRLLDRIFDPFYAHLRKVRAN